MEREAEAKAGAAAKDVTAGTGASAERCWSCNRPASAAGRLEPVALTTDPEIVGPDEKPQRAEHMVCGGCASLLRQWDSNPAHRLLRLEALRNLDYTISGEGALGIDWGKWPRLKAEMPWVTMEDCIDAVIGRVIADGHASSVRILILSHLGLERMPEGALKLPELRVLWLCDNSITAVPEGIKGLENLEELDLTDNRISLFPEAVRAIKGLTELSIGLNDLRSVPGWIWDLPLLESLELHGNLLESIPAIPCRHTHMRRLRLDENLLASLPASIGNLENLEVLDISDNCIDSLPESLGSLMHLAYIDATDNYLNGVPEALWRNSNLSWVDLRGNLSYVRPPKGASTSSAAQTGAWLAVELGPPEARGKMVLLSNTPGKRKKMERRMMEHWKRA